MSSSPRSQFDNFLYLADLAGSERLKKSEVSGDAMKESLAVNMSLTVLGAVFKARVS